MTVKELILELGKLGEYDQNRVVILAGSEEGNSFFNDFEIQKVNDFDEWYNKNVIEPIRALIFYPFNS